MHLVFWTGDIFTSLSHFVRGSAMLVLLDDSCFARLLGGSHARARLLFEGNSCASLGGTIRSCTILSGCTPGRSRGRGTRSPTFFGWLSRPSYTGDGSKLHSRMGLLILRCSVSLARSLL